MKLFIYLSIITSLIFNTHLSTRNSLKVGDMTPNFTLIDENGIEFTSSDYYNKQPLVIFFYPRDNSPVCTTEVCSFRDSFEDFKDLNAKIVGISRDNIMTHRDFSSKYKLPYSLLSDHSGRIHNLFGVSKGFLGLNPERVTFISNKKGRIIYIFKKRSQAEKHTSEALLALKKNE